MHNPTTPTDTRPNPKRLKKRAQFLRAAKGRKEARPGLVLQYHPRQDDPDPSIRFGLTATRKMGGAVERNRARRRLRALAHDLLPTHARQGSDYVLIARATTPSRQSADLRRDLLSALRRIHRPRNAPREAR